MAHFPANNIISAADEQRFTLTQLDATRAARAGVVVTPTASLNQSQQRDQARVALVRQYQAANLKLLKAAGVKIAVGTDNVEDMSSDEFHYLASLDVFTNAGTVTRLERGHAPDDFSAASDRANRARIRGELHPSRAQPPRRSEGNRRDRSSVQARRRDSVALIPEHESRSKCATPP